MKKKIKHRRMLSKLRSRAGETLVETLVALLIGTIALAMLASMIGSTSRLIEETQGVLKDYYAATAQLASHTKTDSDVTKSTGLVKINCSKFILSGNENTTPVTYYTATSGTHTITTYERGTE